MTPGVKTSEFYLTSALVLVGIVLEALAAFCGTLTCGAWLQPVSLIGGVILQLGAALGYGKGRIALKVAASDAEVQAAHAGAMAAATAMRREQLAAELK